jgi:hypothetical protein
MRSSVANAQAQQWQEAYLKEELSVFGTGIEEDVCVLLDPWPIREASADEDRHCREGASTRARGTAWAQSPVLSHHVAGSAYVGGGGAIGSL